MPSLYGYTEKLNLVDGEVYVHALSKVAGLVAQQNVMACFEGKGNRTRITRLKLGDLAQAVDLILGDIAICIQRQLVSTKSVFTTSISCTMPSVVTLVALKVTSPAGTEVVEGVIL